MTTLSTQDINLQTLQVTNGQWTEMHLKVLWGQSIMIWPISMHFTAGMEWQNLMISLSTLQGHCLYQVRSEFSYSFFLSRFNCYLLKFFESKLYKYPLCCIWCKLWFLCCCFFLFQTLPLMETTKIFWSWGQWLRSVSLGREHDRIMLKLHSYTFAVQVQTLTCNIYP